MTTTASTHTLMELMESFAEQIAVDEGSSGKQLTAAQRKDAHRNMLQQFDLDKLLAMQEKMVAAIDRMTANQIDLDENSGFLSAAKAEELMVELLDQTDIKELLEVRRDMIRAAVFAHLTEEARQAGDPEPEYTPGAIPVPALGKKFVREDGGRAAPRLDEEMFRREVGEDWERFYRVEVVPEQVIPEHVEYILDPDKVMELADGDPKILEALRNSVIPGNRRTPRFTVRKL